MRISDWSSDVCPSDLPRLRAFVDRASAADLAQDRWLDGIDGLLTGRRPDAWSDTTIDEYCYEVRVIAGRLASWLALARTKKAVSAELFSVHVVGVDGSEDVLVVRRDRPNAEIVRAPVSHRVTNAQLVSRH